MSSGFAHTLTPQQAEELAALKRELTKHELFNAHYHDDRFLLRFLRATMSRKKTNRTFNHKLALVRLLETFKWRKEFEVDSIRDMIDAGRDENGVEGWEISSKVNVHVMVTNEETGELFRFDRFAAVISQLDTEVLTERQWVCCTAYFMEKVLWQLRMNSAKHGREIPTYSTIGDCEGVSLGGIIARRAFVQSMSQVSADHYPETMEHILLFNTPWYFPQVYNLLSPFIDSDTLSKLKIHSGTPLEEIEKLLPRKYILEQLGGDNTAAVLPQPQYKF